jgi:quercetin dioxygenase-like cupin family protein
MEIFQSLNEIQPKEIFSGWVGKMIHGEAMTVVHYQAIAGSPFSEHSHPHEQISSIISGELEMIVGGEKRHCKAGDVCVIPSNVVHSGKALTDAYVVDVFSPVREDYR